MHFVICKGNISVRAIQVFKVSIMTLTFIRKFPHRYPASWTKLDGDDFAFPVIVLHPGYFPVFDFAARLRNKKKRVRHAESPRRITKSVCHIAIANDNPSALRMRWSNVGKPLKLSSMAPKLRVPVVLHFCIIRRGVGCCQYANKCMDVCHTRQAGGL